MHKKVLVWFPQLSSVTPEGKIKLEGDSNWLFARNIANNIAKNYENVSVVLVIPKRDQLSESLFKTSFHDNVFPFPMKFATKAEAGRFSFDYEEVITLFKTIIRDHGNPDAVWMNEPCLVMNMKFILNELKLLDSTKIFNYNHWIDNSEFAKIDHDLRRVSYTLRQTEAVINSDATFLNSAYAKEMLFKSFKEFGMDAGVYNEKIATHLHLLDSESILGVTRKPHNLPYKVFIYNHRLSSFGYYQEAFQDLLYVCDKLPPDSFKVLLTNPSGKNFAKERPYLELVEGLPYGKYLQLLADADAQISTFRPGNGGMWSMSIMEALALGTPAFIPNHSGYCEIPSTKSYYPLLYDSLGGLLINLMSVVNDGFNWNAIKPTLTTEKELINQAYNPKTICSMLYSILFGER